MPATRDSETRAGLKGVVAGRSEICYIDGESGALRYRGHDIHDLANSSSFEETVHILWNGELPDRNELADLTTLLARKREVEPDVLDLVRRAPRDADPMAILRSAVSALGLHDPEAEDNSPDANRRKAARLTAKTATLTAAIVRCRRGEEPLDPDPALSHAANFLYMSRGRRPDDEAARAMDVALVLHADHGFNASTFAARVTAATLSDLHSAVTSAIGTLKGPLHGGANRKVREMLEEIGDPDRVERWLDRKLDAGERIMGFGHRVYRVEDPRARHLRAHAQALAGDDEREWLEIQRRLVELVGARKGLAVNVDFYSATLYSFLGLAPEIYPLLFATSRVAGWSAHVMEQHADNRLIRPRAEYVGHVHRPYLPLHDR